MLRIIANLGTAGDGWRGAGCFFGLPTKARVWRRNALKKAACTFPIPHAGCFFRPSACFHFIMQRFAASLYLLMFSRLHARLERLWHIPFFYALALALIAAATPLAFAPYYHFWLMPLLFGALIRLAELKPKHMVLSAYLFWLL